MRRDTTYLLLVLSTFSLVAWTMPYGSNPAACLAIVRGTLYSQIAPDLKPAFIATATNILKNQSGTGISAIGSMALLQAAGVEENELKAIKTETFRLFFENALEQLGDVIELEKGAGGSFFPPDLSLAQALIDKPLFVPNDNALLVDGPASSFEKKWGLDELKLQTFLLRAHAYGASPVLGQIMQSYLELALQLNQHQHAHQILLRIIYNGDLATMLHAAVLMDKPALIINVARLAFIERLYNPAELNTLDTATALKTLGDITDPKFSEVARAMLYDFALRLVHPKFLKQYAFNLKQSFLDETSQAAMLHGLKILNNKLALMALFQIGVEPPGATFAPGAEMKMKILENGPAKTLASNIIENLSTEEATDVNLARIIVWLAPSLQIREKLLAWGNHLARQPRMREFAAELLYRAGDFQHARKILTGAIERELSSYPTPKSLESHHRYHLGRAVRTLADFRDEIGLTWLRSVLATHVSALYGQLANAQEERYFLAKQRVAIREREQIMQKLERLQGNLTTEACLSEFQPSKLEHHSVRHILNQSASISNRLKFNAEFATLDDDTRRELIAAGIDLVEEHPIEASGFFAEAGYRRGVVQAAHVLAANKYEPEAQDWALALYVLASHLQDIPEPPAP